MCPFITLLYSLVTGQIAKREKVDIKAEHKELKDDKFFVIDVMEDYCPSCRYKLNVGFLALNLFMVTLASMQQCLQYLVIILYNLC